MLFDPIVYREKAQENVVRRLLNAQYDETKPMGNIAAYHLNQIVELILVGGYARVAPIMPRALGWLEAAIDGKEDFGASKNFHRQRLYWAKAIYQWLLNGEPACEVWARARIYNEEAVIEGNAYASEQISTLRLDDYMAFCVGAREFTAGIAEFEKFYGATSLSLTSSLQPREFGYAVCLHRANGEFEQSQLTTAGRKMLRSHLQETWLGHAQCVRAATWLKIVHWDAGNTSTPIETVLRAYDDMPKVQRPAFV